MRLENSAKNLLGRTDKDPWNCLVGRRPDSYRLHEVGVSLMNQIDHALLERDLDRAIYTGVIFEKWAEWDLHFNCKAPAVMAAVYAVCGIYSEAEKKLMKAKERANRRKCKDCKAHFYKRNSVYLIHNGRPHDALDSYNHAVDLFEELNDPLQKAQCMIGRGAVQYILRNYERGLTDQEQAIELLAPFGSIFVIAASVNTAAILTKMGKGDLAREKVDELQCVLEGIRNIERLKLVLRWIKALLLEETGKREDLKLAGQLLDRVETRMRKHDMTAEIRVLLADRARMARDPNLIRRIASKAFDLELSPMVRGCIENVIRDPSRDNIVAWRDSLDSYVPPFLTAA